MIVCLGRRTQVQQGGNTTAFVFSNLGLLLQESQSAGTLTGVLLTNGWDGYGRRTTLSLRPTNGASAILTTYGYDTASRLAGVTHGAVSAHYGYLANSPLLATLTFKHNGTNRMTTSRQHDFLNRLTAIGSVPGAADQLPVSFTYDHNAANQRRRITLADGSFWSFAYDALGQVTSGKRFWQDGTPVPGQQFEYGFDDIGNRTQTKSGGDQFGAGLREAAYSNSVSNQITSRDVPGGFDVLGIANPQATVKVNGSEADYRRGEYFRESVSVSNGSTSVWQSVSVVATNSGSSSTWPTGFAFAAKTPEVFVYDLDGNLTQDGRWSYGWDGENRLLSLVSLTNTPTESKRKLEFSYDYQGRRISKRVSNYTNSTWQVVSSNLFAYDGWNLLAELNATNRAVIRSYVWGLDLSGSEQGAGGVGGLLYVTPSGSNPQAVGFDGNGNVMALIDAGTGTTAANYEYGPFGEVIRVSGSQAAQNTLRFSTKFTDEESQLVYYGYRYYSPSTGRWLSRDPIFDRGFHRSRAQSKKQRGRLLAHQTFASPYLFVSNDPCDMRDYLGLQAIGRTPCPKDPELDLVGYALSTAEPKSFICAYAKCNAGSTIQYWEDREVVGASRCVVEYWEGSDDGGYCLRETETMTRQVHVTET